MAMAVNTWLVSSAMTNTKSSMIFTRHAQLSILLWRSNPHDCNNLQHALLSTLLSSSLGFTRLRGADVVSTTNLPLLQEAWAGGLLGDHRSATVIPRDYGKRRTGRQTYNAAATAVCHDIDAACIALSIFWRSNPHDCNNLQHALLSTLLSSSLGFTRLRATKLPLQKEAWAGGLLGDHRSATVIPRDYGKRRTGRQTYNAAVCYEQPSMQQPAANAPQGTTRIDWMCSAGP